MSTLLHQFGGNVRNALAAYNAGPGNLQGGYGYADSILAAAGKGVSYTASGGTGASSSGGGGGQSVQQAQLDSFLSAGVGGGMLKDAGALLHGAAIVIDRGISLFAPGNGWRIVFTGVTIGAGFAAYKTYTTGSGGEAENTHLPAAILLTGIALTAGFMAFRTWPQAAGVPIKPGAYVVDVLRGEPPPACLESLAHGGAPDRGGPRDAALTVGGREGGIGRQRHHRHSVQGRRHPRRPVEARRVAVEGRRGCRYGR